MSAFAPMSGIWLDVTRLLTRVGRGAPTGIDRVELAYLDAVLANSSARYLCRTTRGFLALDHHGAACLRDLIAGRRTLGPADVISRVTFRGSRPRHQAEAMLRPLAIDHCSPGGLSRMLGRQGDGPFVYINVGHSNLSEVTLSAFASRRATTRLVIMIHDLIPLTHPEVVVDGQPAAFARRVERVRRYASHVIANSAATSASLDTLWAGKPSPDHRVIAPLGVARHTRSDSQHREAGSFVMLGTIEPRKNHGLMIDVWELLASELPIEDVPHLHIIGNIGWKVEPLIARIKKHPLTDRRIRLHGPLSDDCVQDHLARATALLFPSVIEGYGYPPLEAALAGAVPICSDLPVLRETLEDYAVYVPGPDAYQWTETIKKYLNGALEIPDISKLKVPTWQEHFDIVTGPIGFQPMRDQP